MISCSRLFLDSIVIWRVREQSSALVAGLVKLSFPPNFPCKSLQVLAKDRIAYGAVAGI